MILVMRHPIIIWLTITLLIGQLGCVPALQFPPPLPPRLSDQIRAQLGTIGVSSARFIPKAEFRTPARGFGPGAWIGAAKASRFVEGAACSGLGCGGVFILGLAAVMVGAVAGGATALPPLTVDEAEATVEKAFAELKIQEAMREHLVQVARQQTRHQFVLLAEQGPHAVDEKVSSILGDHSSKADSYHSN